MVKLITGPKGLVVGLTAPPGKAPAAKASAPLRTSTGLVKLLAKVVLRLEIGLAAWARVRSQLVKLVAGEDGFDDQMKYER